MSAGKDAEGGDRLYGRRYFIQAVANNDVVRVRQMLAVGASVNSYARHSSGSAVTLALDRGLEMVCLLCEAGANLERAGNRGSVLTLAVRRYPRPLVLLLLAFRADPTTDNVLMSAIQRDGGSSERDWMHTVLDGASVRAVGGAAAAVSTAPVRLANGGHWVGTLGLQNALLMVLGQMDLLTLDLLLLRCCSAAQLAHGQPATHNGLMQQCAGWTDDDTAVFRENAAWLFALHGIGWTGDDPAVGIELPADNGAPREHAETVHRLARLARAPCSLFFCCARYVRRNYRLFDIEAVMQSLDDHLSHQIMPAAALVADKSEPARCLAAARAELAAKELAQKMLAATEQEQRRRVDGDGDGDDGGSGSAAGSGTAGTHPGAPPT